MVLSDELIDTKLITIFHIWPYQLIVNPNRMRDN
jgi:hypothetical protein